MRSRGSSRSRVSAAWCCSALPFAIDGVVGVTWIDASTAAVTADTPFSLTAMHTELRAKGCGSFLIDLRQAPRESWNDIIGAFKTGRAIAGTTEFNYATGLV